MEIGVERGRNRSKETSLTLAGGAAEGAFWVKRNLIGADVPPGRMGEILPGGLALGHVSLSQTTKGRALLASKPEPTELLLRGGNSEKYRERTQRGQVCEWVLFLQV